MDNDPCQSETLTKLASADGTVQDKELSTQVHTWNPHMWELGRYGVQENMSQNKQRRKTQVFNGKEMMDVVVYACNVSTQEAAGQGFLQIKPNLRYIINSRSARVFTASGR